MAGTIITQPSLNSANTTEPHEVLQNTNTLPMGHDPEVITTQPLMSGDATDEEKQQKKFSQFNPKPVPPPVNSVPPQTNDDTCTWCCIACMDCADVAECCVDCCKCWAECCNGCCEGDGCCTGDGGAIDGDGADIGGCLECCTACCDGCGD